MPLTDELVAALTPEHTPSEIYDVPGYEPLKPLEDGPELRRWQWTQTLRLSGFSEYLRRFALGVDGSWYVGVGLVPWTGTEVLMEASAVLREAVHESGYIWGGLVLTSARIPPYLALNLLQLNAHLPRLPVVVRHARYQAQALEVREGGVLLGTAASWVRTTPSHDLGGGLGGCVTASHALGRGVGTYDIRDGGILRGPAASVELRLCRAFGAGPFSFRAEKTRSE